VAWRRIAPNYPLHVAAIAAMGALFLAARYSAAPFDPAPFDLKTLPAYLLLVHAWGALPTVYWNFPSWLLSAELFGCVLLPLFAVAARGGLVRAAVFAALALIGFELGFIVAEQKGLLFTDMTAQIGAARAVPDFMMGAALCRLAQGVKLRSWESLALSSLSLAWIVAGALLRLSDDLIWPAFGPLVFGVATLQGPARAVVEAPAVRYLGRIAWAVYLVHLPVEIAWFHALDRVFGPGAVPAPVALLGAFAAIFVVGISAHHLIERPAWRALHRRLAGSDRRLAPRETVQAA
jgi:peptidoglycan/LPS O-acetylase OafA/YrhL